MSAFVFYGNVSGKNSRGFISKAFAILMIVTAGGFFLPLLKTSAVFAAADAVHSVVFEHKASAVRTFFLLNRIH